MDNEPILISYEVALAAKKSGFSVPVVNYYIKEKRDSKPYITQGIEYNDRDCDCFFDEKVSFDWNLNTPDSKQIRAPYPNKYSKHQVSAPSQTLLCKWLRDIHGIHVVANIIEPGKYNYELAVPTKNRRSGLYHIYGVYEGFSYEEATEDGLRKVFNENLIKK